MAQRCSVLPQLWRIWLSRSICTHSLLLLSYGCLLARSWDVFPPGNIALCHGWGFPKMGLPLQIIYLNVYLNRIFHSKSSSCWGNLHGNPPCLSSWSLRGSTWYFSRPPSNPGAIQTPRTTTNPTTRAPWIEDVRNRPHVCWLNSNMLTIFPCIYKYKHIIYSNIEHVPIKSPCITSSFAEFSLVFVPQGCAQYFRSGTKSSPFAKPRRVGGMRRLDGRISPFPPEPRKAIHWAAQDFLRTLSDVESLLGTWNLGGSALWWPFWWQWLLMYNCI